MAAHGHMHRVHARKHTLESIAAAAASDLGIPGIFQESQPSTIISYVYVTKPKTFSGEVGGYSTATGPATTEAAKTTATHTSTTALVADTSSTRSSSHTTLETSTGLPKSITAPSSSSDLNGNDLVVASSSTTKASSTALTTNTASTTAVAKSSGITAGAQAGLAIGVLCLVGTIAGLVFFFWKKRRDASRQRIEDEKSDVWGGADRMASTRSNPVAPRLSLRPVTQFLPNLGERRQSRNALAMAGASPAGGHRYSWERPVGPDANKSNPFGNHAETIDSANANGPPVVENVSSRGEIIAASAAGAAAGGAALLTRGASKRENGPRQMDFTTNNPMLPPVSPVGTEFSMSSEAGGAPTPTAAGAAIAAAGGPVNSTVHRVQLDFKPSMDDELELRAGQLIRLLHEYDDGWALCIRLDRSAQGVVPRTCLSVRPVKPRPQQNGPRGPPPGMRGPNGQPRPMSPSMNQGPRNQGPRPMSPAMAQGRVSPSMNQSRPSSPASNRPMNPNGQGRPRSPSASQMQDRRNSPPGPSRMNPNAGPVSPVSPQTSQVGRKPVPGQAM